MKTCFIGTSGKFYIKNPFGTAQKHTYAVYNSIDAYRYMEHLPTYTTAAEAEKDFKEEVQKPEVISKRAPAENRTNRTL